MNDNSKKFLFADRGYTDVGYSEQGVSERIMESMAKKSPVSNNATNPIMEDMVA